MKYHVTIEAAYWAANVPGWEGFSPRERGIAIRATMERISAFLNEEVQFNETRLLLTDKSITIDPLHGDVGIRPMDAMERNSHLPEEGATQY